MNYSIKVEDVSKTFKTVKRRFWFQNSSDDDETEINVSYKKRKRIIWKTSDKYTTALDHVSLNVPRGEILGLLGPNGAGKTTLAKIVSTLVLPDSGIVSVNGYNVATETVMSRFSLGLVTGGERSLYWKLTPLQNLRFFGGLYGMNRSEATQRANELIRIFGLKEKSNELVQNLSTGQKMRVAFARGLMHDPEVLILDEYNRGLDPNVSKQLRDYIKKVLQKEEDKTVLLMTHEMNVAEDLCNRIMLINNGKIVTEGTPAELISELSQKIVIEVETHVKITDQTNNKLEELGKLEISNGNGLSNIKLLVNNSPDITFDVLKVFKNSDIKIDNFNLKKPNLEDVFVHYTGRKLEDEEEDS